MCGIVGQVSTSKLIENSEHMHSSMSLMPHRGPDAKAIWENETGNIRLGHVRLSIQDPRPGGTQPMHFMGNEGLISVVFNGEIYNFIELKDELMSLGYVFVTQTDTEVLLCAYAAWGERCVDRFNGMFAIALFDAAKNTFYLFRDRMGEKPLYYHIDESGTLSFASEMKVLKHMVRTVKPLVSDLDPILIEKFMEFGYVPGEMPLQAISPCKIMRLLPAHQMAWLVSGNVKPTIKPYWHDKAQVSKKSSKPMDDLNVFQRTSSLIEKSLMMRLRSDVPLGVFLSGGLDSSAIVSWLSPKVSGRLKTFSVRYDMETFGLAYDESMYARQVAALFDTEHHEFTMTPQHFVDYLKEYVHLMDEPVTEAAAVSLHYVSELAKKHVTVVLSGEGSDEIFAGYELYRRMSMIEKIRTCVTPIGASLAAMLGKVVLKPGSKIGKYLQWASLPFEKRYKGISIADPSYREKSYNKRFKLKLYSASQAGHPTDDFMKSVMESSRGDSLLNRMLKFDRKTWLVDDLLIKADRMSMGSSLELRVPFLDHELVEWSNEIPDRLKIKGDSPKHILKQLVPTLPDNIIHREKTGFPTPLEQMFKSGVLYDFLITELNKESCLLWSILDKEVMMSIVEEHRSGKIDHHRYLWQILVLSLWLSENCEVSQVI